MSTPIAVLGSANMDLVVTQRRRPEPGETIFGTGFSAGAGGKGLNQAVAAARAGGDVRMIGAVGVDQFGDQLLRRLESDEIDVSAVVRDAQPTGVAQISVTDDGENSIVVVPGANARAAFTDTERSAIESAGYLVVQLERPASLLQEAMTFARERGVTTVLTPAPVSHDAMDLVALADIMVANEREAQLLAADDDTTAAATALSRIAGIVIITRGSQGAIAAQGGKIIGQVEARRVTAVDTTGAGDTFVGVLVARLADGMELLEAMRIATVAASLTVTRLGAAEAMPSLQEITEALSTGNRR